jgi:RHO1 GDP-GTP exchange protein 1/2
MSTTSAVSISPASSTLIDHPVVSATSRRSSESSKTVPGMPAYHRERTNQDRSMSMSAATNSIRHKPQMHGRLSPTSIRTPTSRKTPIVYPALLSRVAEAFRERIPLSDRLKDGLTYKDAFDGREAVDKIAYIIKTTDRNLALLLGRALDAQKFFHDVTYDHRLRDSAGELYQFRTELPSPFVSGELVEKTENGDANGNGRPPLQHNTSVDSSVLTESSSTPSADDSVDSHNVNKNGSPTSPSPAVETASHPRQASESDEAPLPSGVFTLLTDCYSPTCSRDQLCYSIACPRRLEQQARLNMKPQPGLKKQISRESLGDLVVSFASSSSLFCVSWSSVNVFLCGNRNRERCGSTRCRRKLSIACPMLKRGDKKLSTRSYTLNATLFAIWSIYETHVLYLT